MAAADPPLNTAQFEEIIDLIRKGLATARGVLREIRTADNPLLPDFLEDVWHEEVGPFCLAAEAFIQAVEQVMESAPAPVRLATMATDWGGRIQEYATEVEAKTHWTQLHALDEWEGRAANRYRKRTLPQSSAAGPDSRMSWERRTVEVARPRVVLSGTATPVSSAAHAPGGKHEPRDY